MTVYRDPLAGLLSQIATKRGLLATREESLSALLRVMLPAALSGTLERLRASVDADPDSLDGLTDVDAALDSLLAAHDEAAALVPKLRECPDDVPDPPRSHIRPPWVIEEEAQLEFRAVFTKRLAEVDPDAYVVRWDDTTYLSRLRVARAPFVVSARAGIATGLPTDARCAARTSVPDGVPLVDAHAETALHALGRVLHLVEDPATGDAAFDDAYVLDAPAAAVGIFAPDVRAALMALEPLHARLVVAHGVAEVTWRSDWTPQQVIPDAAIAALLGLRAAIERA